MEHRADRCSPQENDLLSREAADVLKVRFYVVVGKTVIV
jgi:hypothetical protein